MADALFEHPRLAQVYDALEPDRSDLELYAGIVTELGAHTVLDVGCGTGTFAVLLAGRGVTVTGLDPAAASLAVAQQKAGAENVRWIHGDARALPPMQVDLAVMTGNVAQAIAGSDDWAATLSGVHEALRPGGHLVFETRDPADEAWRTWTREASHCTVEVVGVGSVESWEEVTDIDGPLVTFRCTRVFASDGAVLTSDSTIRFRSRDEIVSALLEHGYAVQEVRDAPDYGGREMVFIARRPAEA